MGYVPADQIFGYKMWLESNDLKDSNRGRFHNRTEQNWQTFKSQIICLTLTLTLTLLLVNAWW